MLFNDLKGEQKKTSKRNLFLNDFKVNRKLGYLPFASFPEAAPTYYIILDSAKKKGHYKKHYEHQFSLPDASFPEATSKLW